MNERFVSDRKAEIKVIMDQFQRLHEVKETVKNQLEDTIVEYKTRLATFSDLDELLEQLNLRLENKAAGNAETAGLHIEKAKVDLKLENVQDVLETRKTQKRQIEAQKLKKQEAEFIQGLNYMDARSIKIKYEKYKTVFDYLYDFAVWLNDAITPFKAQLREIETTQSKAITALFVFI